MVLLPPVLQFGATELEPPSELLDLSLLQLVAAITSVIVVAENKVPHKPPNERFCTGQLLCSGSHRFFEHDSRSKFRTSTRSLLSMCHSN
jgi:hypothetical protein